MTAPKDVLALYLGIAARSNERAVLRLLVDLGRQYARADEGSLLVTDRKRSRLVFAMTSGSPTSEKVLVGQSVPLGQGLTGLAAATGEVQIGAPTFKDVRMKTRSDASAAEPHHVLAAPMMVGDEAIGVLTAVRFEAGRPFTADDAACYAKIAAIAGVVVDQQRRLAALAEAAEGARPREGRTAPPPAEAKIVESVHRLTGGVPRRLEIVADVMAAIESLCREGSP